MTTETLAPPQRRESLGQVLVRIGAITDEQLRVAAKKADPFHRNLGSILVELKYATEEQLLKALSISLGVTYFAVFDGLIDQDTASRLLPEMTARRLLALPLFKLENTLTLAMVNPVDIHAIDEVSRITGLRVLPVVTTLENLLENIQRAYGRSAYTKSTAPVQETRLHGPEAAAPPTADPLIAPEVKSNSIIDIANALFQEGMARKASDIHLEPSDKSLSVRFRVDGVLQRGKNLARDLSAALVARIKILSKLDITETRLPQDGRMRFVYAGRGVDVRVSTLPTVHGEKIVMRLLDSSKSILKLPDLGLETSILQQFSSTLRSPNGLILVTGPTGSGKTTTLYAALSTLHNNERNIVTLEDPVEYVMEGINQVEAFPKIGLNFASGLRSILRQDPNVILVGEIRDLETAEIAMQASMTGHLVLSTLHTNDAVATVHRLLNMRVEPYMIAGSLRGVLAQRLLRRLCAACKKPRESSAEDLKAAGATTGEAGAFQGARGCEACFETGYQGRLPIHEWLSISRRIRDLVLARNSVDDLRKAATEEGFITMRERALERARRGETSLDEVLRLTREQAEA